MEDIRNLEPKEVFKWFYEINQHPRSSGNEKEISDFLVKFAKERNLEVYQDELLNVIIKKPGTEGYENSETLIIQGHMDMVCVKTDDSNHNFDTDPIEMIVDGDLLYANKTTLGADDGIAVAMGLAILDSNDIKHPPIELLVTTNEETGMDGAMALTNEHLSGTRLLNIDTEEEGEFLVSCSGGANIEMSFDIEKVDNKSKGLEILISGLFGGHSGGEIHKQRLNAIKAMARILNSIKNDVTLVSIEGGIKHNAIPSRAKAVISCEDIENVKSSITKISDDIKNEYKVEEPGYEINVKEVDVNLSLTKDLSSRIISFLMALPDGVMYMSKDIDGLVQTSLNNAIIEEVDNKLVLTTSARSCVPSSLTEILERLEVITTAFGGNYMDYAHYPAWQYEEISPLRDISVKTFVEEYGYEPLVNSIHAGLECGLLKEILPNTDMLSYGPTIKDAHTPKENMSISSVSRVWKFTIKLLENLK